jgi:hypothetical protein
LQELEGQLDHAGRQRRVGDDSGICRVEMLATVVLSD